MKREELRANLYKAYIESGAHNHVVIQQNILIAEKFILDNHEFSEVERKALIEKLNIK